MATTESVRLFQTDLQVTKASKQQQASISKQQQASNSMQLELK
jgi:hypothetical protein